jgi:hypothetical protein
MAGARFCGYAADRMVAYAEKEKRTDRGIFLKTRIGTAD